MWKIQSVSINHYFYFLFTNASDKMGSAANQSLSEFQLREASGRFSLKELIFLIWIQFSLF